MSNEEEGGMKRKEGRGGSSDEEEGATGRVKKMKEKLLKNKEKSINFNPWRRIAQGQK